MAPGKIFFLGFGYCARALAGLLQAESWAVSGSCQDEASWDDLKKAGFEAISAEDALPPEALAGVTHFLNSVPPGGNGDPFISSMLAAPEKLQGIPWTGYLSSLGVYGGSAGELMGEGSIPKPSHERAKRRLEAEQAWQALDPNMHVFRLAGIYGPGRSTLDRVRAGRAERIEKPGHEFSRIHVADVVAVLRASINRPNAGAIYNVLDDEAAAQARVVEYACGLLGTKPPPLIPFDEAQKTLSPMSLSFWQDFRRVDNSRIKKEQEMRPAYPTYREGLTAIFEDGG